MKSNKQRRMEIKARRMRREKRAQATHSAHNETGRPPSGAIPSDVSILSAYNATYGPLPEYYVDQTFHCRDCGEAHVWTAEQQKWWYEVAHGNINSHAIRCRRCRQARRAQRDSVPGANRLRTSSQRLRALGTNPPTAEARLEVEQALSSKWWGLRALAISVLGRWAEPADIDKLKSMLETREGGFFSWNGQRYRAAFKALCPVLRPQDAEWAIEFCMRQSHAYGVVYLHSLSRNYFCHVPESLIRATIKAEVVRGDAQRLQNLASLLKCIDRSDWM